MIANERLTRDATFFAALLAASFLLRIFYAGHLYQDDGLWFTAAEEVLRGRALYSQIYFDKPPALPLLYALLFGIFGAHILVIRLFTILYAAIISVVLYFFGARLYDRGHGKVAAAMFIIFSTTQAGGHAQGLNTDFLAALPYSAAAYFFVRSCSEARGFWAFLGGALAGAATQANPKAALSVPFFAALIAVYWRWFGALRARSAMKLFALAAIGFASGNLPFLLYIAATKSLSHYWSYVWDWGARYALYHSPSKVIAASLRHSAGYFALNNTLFFGLLFVAIATIKRALRGQGHDKSDVAILIWFIFSYAGVALGGRFYHHYFFQALPSLCLIGARGIIGIIAAIQSRRPMERWAAISVLMLGFLITIVRFHGRTAILAADWIAGKKSQYTMDWLHERMNREERMVAAEVRGLPAESVDGLGLEELRRDGPRSRPPDGPADYLFVWGYRPEIYYWSGLLPASRFLSVQPLTGVPADVHYINGERRSIIDAELAAAARRELAQELKQIKPKYIIDELGFFNSALGIEVFPELQEVIRDYKNTGATGRFFIYRRKDMKKRKATAARTASDPVVAAPTAVLEPFGQSHAASQQAGVAGFGDYLDAGIWYARRHRLGLSRGSDQQVSGPGYQERWRADLR